MRLTFRMKILDRQHLNVLIELNDFENGLRKEVKNIFSTSSTCRVLKYRLKANRVGRRVHP